MDGVVRHIRTSGRGSGSVEVTLPAKLREFVGLPCRITLREGERTEIVLEPDMADAHAALAGLWHALARALLNEPAPPFLPRDFLFTLHPAPCLTGRASLAWVDGVALARSTPAEPASAATLARLIAAFAFVLADRLAIAAHHAPGFGAVCGLLTTGACPFAEWREPTEIAASILYPQNSWHPGSARFVLAGGDKAALFEHAGELLAAADLFASWSDASSDYPALSAAWRRGHSFEMNRV